MNQVLTGDCLDIMPTLNANSVDAVVTDPPYGLSFMGKDWDHGVPGAHFWQAALRVMKPGAHLLAFGGTRTFHRLTCAIENAGFEVRDCLMWLYGSGFPKSLDVSKAIDKAAGAPREVVGDKKTPGGWHHEHFANDDGWKGGCDRITAPATDAAKRWNGWGTALKPAWEPIILARKPLDGTVAENVQRWGTGAINVNSGRIPAVGYTNGGRNEGIGVRQTPGLKHERCDGSQGRWPANVILDEEAGAMLDEQSGILSPGHAPAKRNTGFWADKPPQELTEQHFGKGGASRFFYCAKASKAERNRGLQNVKPNGNRPLGISNWKGQTNGSGEVMGPSEPMANNHPTVKPVALLEYLIRLVTPPSGLILDPFCGSGSTGVAALGLGFRFLGIEKEPSYVEIAQKRIDSALRPLVAA